MENRPDISTESLSEDTFNALMGDVPDNVGIGEDLIVVPEKQSSEEKTSSKKSSKTTEAPKEVEQVEEAEEVEHDLDGAIAELTGEADGTVEESTSDEGISSVLKGMGQGLMERGIWKDFEGSEEFDWSDQEAVGHLAQIQARWAAEEMFDEMVDQTGDFGKTVFSHIKNGGDPGEIIGLFRESKRIENFDISTPEGQENIVREYYSKLGWNNNKIKNFVKSLVDSGSLESEAEDSKALLGEAFNKEVERTKQEQEEYIAEQERIKEEFNSNITRAVKARKDMSDKDKKDILDSLLKVDKKLQNGRVVNQFALDFMKMQSDPERYIELVAFVRNPDKYMEKVTKKEETAAVKKTWDFIKGGSSLKKNAGGSQTKSSTKGSDLRINYKDFN